MIIHGNYTLLDTGGAFVFWGESNKYKHKRGNPKNIAPLYPDLADVKELENILGKGALQKRLFLFWLYVNQNANNPYRLLEYRIKCLSYGIKCPDSYLLLKIIKW